MKEDEHHHKAPDGHNCPECGSENTWYVDVVPYSDVSDCALYCEDCRGTFV